MEQGQGQEEENEEGGKRNEEVKPCRILILGDGNFSFSLALARALLSRQQSPAAGAGDGGIEDPDLSVRSGTAREKSSRASEEPTLRQHQRQQQQQQQQRQQRQQIRRQFEIVATSFDGPLDLLGKYPETPGILASLRSLGVTVLHNVDATSLDARVVHAGTSQPELGEKRTKKEVVQAAVEDKGIHWNKSPGEKSLSGAPAIGSECSSICSHAYSKVGGVGGGQGSIPTRHHWQYDHVIFNHPHTGTEDMRRHRSFLGHFFHAVLQASAIASISTSLGAVAASDNDGDGGGGNSNATIGAGSHAAVGSKENATISILAPGGAIHVTLAGDQPERWGLREQATRHGFCMAHRRRFPAEHIDGYMTKRHQTGRSFQRHGLDSDTLSFVLRTKTDSGNLLRASNDNRREEAAFSSVGGSPGRRRNGGTVERQEECGEFGDDKEARAYDAIGRREKGQEAAAPKGGNVAGEADNGRALSAGVSTLPPWLWPEIDISGERDDKTDGASLSGEGAPAECESVVIGDDKLQTAAAECERRKIVGGGGVNARKSGRGGSVPLLQACELCGKRYKTAQAVRTHTRQVHELGQEGGGVALAATDSKEQQLKHACPHCDRVFTSNFGLDQHVSAKHRGDNLDIKPDWFVGSIYLPAQPPTSTSANGGGGGGGGTATIREGLERVLIENEACPVSGDGVWVPSDEAELKNDDRCNANKSGSALGQSMPPPPPPPPPPPTTSGFFSGSTQCEICGYWFSTPENARRHLDNLRPPIEGGVTRYDCVSCAKDFGSKRALLQHANFCGRKV